MAIAMQCYSENGYYADSGTFWLLITEMESFSEIMTSLLFREAEGFCSHSENIS